MATDAELIEALRQVIDPELMVNVVDLGLIYSVNQTDRKVAVEMTLTSPACPAGPQIVQQAKMGAGTSGGCGRGEHHDYSVATVDSGPHD